MTSVRVAAAADAVARALLWTGALLVLAATAPVALGWRADVVMTGSMRPAIAPGDVVVSRPVSASGVRAGEIVLVEDPARPGTTLVHRVVRINPDGSLVTRGDANAGPDSTPVPPDLVRARPCLRIPLAGLPVRWARTGDHGRLAAFAAVLGLLVACVRRPQPAPAAAGARPRAGGRHRAFAAMPRRTPAHRPR